MAIVFALNNFKNYLFGKHFIVYCDQQFLSNILTLKDPNSRIARWMLTLQQFDYAIIHKPGRSNQMADYLPRAKYPKEEPLRDTYSSGVTGFTTPRYPSIWSPFIFPPFSFDFLLPSLEGRRGSSP
ncbi:hypothetical protein AVEN_228338-1 [Araneus ventricosus]|uniref:Reverse transcriptase RNase H-like domain-containing protein n=1 Tax=Araneus ventricosus TaxID=182803 RepID=A0A4Y2K849_ARAVE|nr:hypothetical protein AVEN_228338-1 [Araneus ventricosus]